MYLVIDDDKLRSDQKICKQKPVNKHFFFANGEKYAQIYYKSSYYYHNFNGLFHNYE